MKNGSWVTFNFVVLAVGGWIISLLFARLGSKELLGQYQLILSILSIVSVFSLPGLNAAALEAVVKGRDVGIIRAVKTSFLFSLVGALVLIGVGVLNLLIRDNFILGVTFIFSGIISPFYYALNTWRFYYEGKSLFKESSLRTILVNICLYFALGVGLLLGLGIFWLILIFLTVNTLFFGYYFWRIVKKIKNRTRDFIDVKFGVSVSIQKLVLGFSTNIPPIVISLFFGVDAVAIYYIAYYVISAISSFLGALISLYLPTLFKGWKLNHRNKIFQNIFIGFSFWVVFIIILKFFFIFIYGSEYQMSLELGYRISFLLLFIPLKIYLISFLMTRRKNWFLISVFSVANLLAFLVLYLLRGEGFLSGVTIYFYVLELSITIPLLIMYIFNTSLRNSFRFSKINWILKVMR